MCCPARECVPGTTAAGMGGFTHRGQATGTSVRFLCASWGLLSFYWCTAPQSQPAKELCPQAAGDPPFPYSMGFLYEPLLCCMRLTLVTFPIQVAVNQARFFIHQTLTDAYSVPHLDEPQR